MSRRKGIIDKQGADRSQMGNKGITLTEILIVVIVIAILAALGLPAFVPWRERSLQREAIAHLKLMAAAEKVYSTQYRSYYPSPPGIESDPANLSSFLRILVNERYWDYSITSTAVGYSVTADRAATGCQYVLDSADADGEPNPNASCR